MENLVGLHATKIVQSGFAPRTAEGGCPNMIFTRDCHFEGSEKPWVPLHHHCRLILLVRPFEIRNLVITLKMPNSCRDLIDQVVIVTYQ